MLDNIISSLPNEVITGLVGSLIIIIVNFSYYKVKDVLHSRQYSGLVDNYYIYFHSTSVLNNIVEANFSIKKSLGKLTVNLITTDFKLTGYLIINERNIYIKCTGVNHLEEVLFTFMTPLHKKIRKLWGILSGVSVIGEPCSWVCLLSKQKMTKEEVLYMFNLRGLRCENAILKIKHDMSNYLDNTDFMDVDSQKRSIAKDVFVELDNNSSNSNYYDS